MDQSSDQTLVRRSIAVRALETMMSAAGPFRVSHLFWSDDVHDVAQQREAKDTKWQLLFLLALTKKNAVSRVHKPGDGRPTFAVQNRFFVISLLEDARHGGKRIDDLIGGRETTPNASPAPQPRKVEVSQSDPPHEVFYKHIQPLRGFVDKLRAALTSPFFKAVAGGDEKQGRFGSSPYTRVLISSHEVPEWCCFIPFVPVSLERVEFDLDFRRIGANTIIKQFFDRVQQIDQIPDLIGKEANGDVAYRMNFEVAVQLLIAREKKFFDQWMLDTAQGLIVQRDAYKRNFLSKEQTQESTEMSTTDDLTQSAPPPPTEDAPHSWLQDAPDWDEKILVYIEGKTYVTTATILVEAIGLQPESLNNAMKKYVGGVLRTQGWTPRDHHDGNKKIRIWQPEGASAPSSLPEAPLETPMDGSSDVVQFLKSMHGLMTYSVELQHKIAENLVYLRKRGDELHAEVQNLNQRVQTLEEAPDASRSDGVSEGIQKMLASVSSLKSDVEDLVGVALKTADDGKMTRVADAIELLKTEFAGLRAEARSLIEENSDE